MTLADEKQAFTRRLKEALQRAGVDPCSYARVARDFNLRYPGDPVSPQAVRKWLTGGSLPSQDKIRAMSLWLDVGVQWLRFGDVERKPERARVSVRQDVAAYKTEPAWIARKFEALDDAHKKIVLEIIHALLRLEGKQ